ncbi:hypothetical protein [Algoriphagus sanaruensis]|uniref:Uncharacterized protein n=1 Tax=Algoriphagus sanaruensis TaxID=1727163 RepID=A0A142ENR9_9BACT|nr:hypothetical protein [Algoriphagus sanaruensis]AMQ56774.1 hypothetical protein AO498_10080 [Algoriphagus sanaruensis]
MKEELRIFLIRLWPLWFLIIGIPVISFLIWMILPYKNLEITLIDKTVPNQDYQEHGSFYWLLDHQKIRKNNGSLYSKDSDYLGFFPSGEADFGIKKDLSKKSKADIESLASKSDLVFFADTYGVYEDDFREDTDYRPSQKIYGGLDLKDIELLTKAKEFKKTVIGEYNVMASPTPTVVRSEFERLMGIKWTGWIARFFDELDSLQNPDIPKWMRDQYTLQHGEYPLKGPGMIFIEESGRIEALLHEEDFGNETPMIRTQLMNKAGFKLPELVPYPDWFDIVLIERDYNVISYFDINPSVSGIQKLRNMGLPRFFPAAIVREIEGAKQYYFSGDFSDFRYQLGSAKFYGLPFFWRGIYLANNYTDRRGFYWNYYYPLMDQIIEQIKKDKP